MNTGLDYQAWRRFGKVTSISRRAQVEGMYNPPRFHAARAEIAELLRRCGGRRQKSHRVSR